MLGNLPSVRLQPGPQLKAAPPAMFQPLGARRRPSVLRVACTEDKQPEVNTESDAEKRRTKRLQEQSAQEHRRSFIDGVKDYMDALSDDSSATSAHHDATSGSTSFSDSGYESNFPDSGHTSDCRSNFGGSDGGDGGGDGGDGGDGGE